MKKLSFAALLLAFSGLALAGLDELEISSNISGNYVLGLMAHDQRDFVIREGYPEKQVGGYVGGMFRTRKATYTNSELSVAQAITEGLRKHFTEKKWLGVSSLTTTAKDTRSDIDRRISDAGLRKTLLITVEDLWAESYRNTSVNYKFTISVKDAQARELASASYTGIHDTRSWGDDAAAEIFSQLMTETLKQPDFIAALKN